MVFACALPACASEGGGNEPVPTTAGLDISGESNAPCTLSVTAGGKTLTFEIAAPTPAVSDAPADSREPISACTIGDAGSVSVTSDPPDALQCVRVSRTSRQLCAEQNSCFGDSLSQPENCPATLTLTCGGVVLYVQAAWQVCRWYG